MANKKLKLVQTPEAPEIENTPLPEKHTAIVWHPAINGLDCYGYTSQEILDVADKVYSLYKTTPMIQLSGDVFVGEKIIRLQFEAAEYVNVTDDHWHLIYSDIDVHPMNGVIPKARVGIQKPEVVEKWEATDARQAYRKKLLTSIKLA